MSTQYEKLIRLHLAEIFEDPPERTAARLPAGLERDGFHFRAFGEPCVLGPEGVAFSGRTVFDPRALLVALYARHVTGETVQVLPLKAFRELPGTMPYQGAFSVNAERVLVPHVPAIQAGQEAIKKSYDGRPGEPDGGGDFSLLLYPLPKIALCYVFYLADEDFPAAATCLFSGNASAFMPLDGLADVAEYTSRSLVRVACGER